MRSLFIRIFLSFWLAMTLVGAGFAVIYASVGPGRFAQRRELVITELLRLEGHVAAENIEAGQRERALDELRAFERKTELTVVVFADGEAPLATRTPTEKLVDVATRARASRRVVREELNGSDLFAVPEGKDVVVGVAPRPSQWERFLGTSTLPLRLLVIFVVTGVISFFLARYLTQPLLHLRLAAQRLAGGDLSVRVAPELRDASNEVAALGGDFDRMAERIATLLESQERLLRDVSHELRSPLARLNVALELARQRAGEEARAPLDRIELESGRLGELIGHILTVSRLDGMKTVEKEAVDIGALVDEVVRDVDYEARGTGRSVELFENDNDKVQVLGNEEVLRWAVENVLRNAIRFTKEHTTVTVRVSRIERESRPFARIEVQDQGPGVPEEALSAIFEPFYRITPDRDRKTGGTGVGLAITDRGVRIHGGQVHARNVPEGGLIITIELPAC